MKKFLAIFLSFFMLLSVCYAEPQNCPFVWKVEKNGEPTSYLIGTIHVNKKGYQLPSCMKKVVENSKVLMTENLFPLHPSEAMQADVILLSQSVFSLSNANQLKDDIGSELHGQLRQLFADANSNDALLMYDRLYGWSAMMFLMGLPANSDVGVESGVDLLLSQLADKNGLQRVGLESVLVGADAIKNVPKDKIIQFINIGIEHQDYSRVMERKLIDLYNSGKVYSLKELALSEEENLKFIPDADKPFWRNWYFNTLLDKRTASWVTKISNQISKSPTVIAVGTAHMYGNNGLVSILRQKGYTVTELR
ncbi:MAG: TraB/GumN family protein [Neisseriaceae bacterium]|nr:TraB/GumN family protein [Neisseriaceae bacterium]